MKSFLILLILLALLGAGFEYQVAQNHATSYTQQLADLTAKRDQLIRDNAKLAETNRQLKNSLALAQGHTADLTSQLKTAEVPAPAPGPAAPPVAASPAAH